MDKMMNVNYIDDKNNWALNVPFSKKAGKDCTFRHLSTEKLGIWLGI